MIDGPSRYSSRSVPQMPHQLTRSSNSPGPGTGWGTSSTRTSPRPCQRAALIGGSPLSALDCDVETNRADDDHALDDAFQISGGAQEHEPVRNHAGNRGAHDCAENATGAAEEIRTPDDDRGDHVQLEPQPGIWIGGVQPGHQQRGSQSDERAGQHEWTDL